MKTPPYLLVSLFLILLNYYPSQSTLTTNQSPFCTVCDCNATVNIVNCTGENFKTPLNTTTFWLVPETNETYPYFKVGIHQSGISRVFQFPASPVEILDLSRNRIQIIDKGAFMNLQNMTELDLSDNEITSALFDPDIFKGIYTAGEYLPLRSMVTLRLANNGLHSLHQDTFEHIANLQTLDLQGNPLRVLDSQTTIAISGLAYLKKLDLSYTYLSKLPDHIFHRPKNLNILNLQGNKFTEIPHQQLLDAKNLQELNLNENPIENITAHNGFPVMENLRILHLCYLERMHRIENGSLSGLWNLKELYISNNHKLTHIDVNALSRREEGVETEFWPTLEKLDLSNNKLTHLPNHFLARWDSLTELDIRDNAWTCECENQWLVDDLVKSLVERDPQHGAEGLWCAAPVELEGRPLEEIYRKNETLRCLDIYGGHPEKDAGVLIGVLTGLLIGIPLVMGLYFCYKRNWFGYFQNGPASFSRKFYNRATADEEFYT